MPPPRSRSSRGTALDGRRRRSGRRRCDLPRSHRFLRARLVVRFFPRVPGELVCGSRPNAPATFLEAGMDRSGYRAPASFCAMDRLPALCDVCRSRRSSSGCSPTRPAASTGGGELVSTGGCFSSIRASALGERRLLIPARSGCRVSIFRFSSWCTTPWPCRPRPATL